MPTPWRGAGRASGRGCRAARSASAHSARARGARARWPPPAAPKATGWAGPRSPSTAARRSGRSRRRGATRPIVHALWVRSPSAARGPCRYGLGPAARWLGPSSSTRAARGQARGNKPRAPPRVAGGRQRGRRGRRPRLDLGARHHARRERRGVAGPARRRHERPHARCRRLPPVDGLRRVPPTGGGRSPARQRTNTVTTWPGQPSWLSARASRSPHSKEPSGAFLLAIPVSQS